MPGSLCRGTDAGDHKSADVKLSKAYCEGAYARTQEVSPSNPHLPSSDAAIAWEKGSGDTFADTVQGCCASMGLAAT